MVGGEAAILCYTAVFVVVGMLLRVLGCNAEKRVHVTDNWGESRPARLEHT